MFNMRKVLLAAALAVFVAGPALCLPTLSAHAPTLSAPTAPASSPLGAHQLPFALGPAAGLIVKSDAGTAGSKWSNRAAAASQDYATGVQGSASRWQQNTAASEQAWAAGVTDAISKKRFGSGVNSGAAAKFVKKATTDGPQRFSSGVQSSADAYAAGVSPYLDTLKGINLPPRGPKGSQQNYQRAQAVAAALRAKKVGS